MEDKNALTRAVVGTFQCQMQLTTARTLNITGHVYSDDTVEDLNRRIDMYQDAVDRQFVRCDIVNKEAQKKAQFGAIEQFRDQLDGLKARQDGAGQKGMKLSSQEKLALQNGEQTIINAQKQIEKLDNEIALAKKQVGMTG
jgi:hypothetical protein